MKLQNNFQPDIPSKAVSTLLEILEGVKRHSERPVELNAGVSTLLEILDADRRRGSRNGGADVSTLLEILEYISPMARCTTAHIRFNPS